VYLHGGGNLRAAAGDRFGRFLNLNHTHPAVACHFETLVVAEARDSNAILLGSLVNGKVAVHFIRLFINEYFNLPGGK